MYLTKLPFQGRYTILAVCDNRGNPILLDFFEELGSNLQKDLDSMLQLLETCASSGPPRNTEISHKIRGEIWEFIKGRLRVLWFYDHGRVIICTHGFIKKSGKTRAQEITRAENKYQEYLASKNEDNIIIQEEEDGGENLQQPSGQG
jgi:phage-related protein